MAKLDTKVKRFIVQALACFDTPTQVAAAVKEEFALEITRMHVTNYDPTKVQGAKLSKELRSLFEETRETFKKNVDAIPIAHQTYRLRVLNRMLASAELAGNKVLVAQLLEQSAKEVGGAYTNQRQLSGPGGKPIEVTDPTRKYTDDELDRRLAELMSKNGNVAAG